MHVLGLPGYQPLIVREKKCEEIVKSPFHFDHLRPYVPKSAYFIHGSESANIFTNLFVSLTALQ